MTRTTFIIMIYVDSDETGQLSSHGFADDELAALYCTNHQHCAHSNLCIFLFYEFYHITAMAQ